MWPKWATEERETEEQGRTFQQMTRNSQCCSGGGAMSNGGRSTASSLRRMSTQSSSVPCGSDESGDRSGRYSTGGLRAICCAQTCASVELVSYQGGVRPMKVTTVAERVAATSPRRGRITSEKLSLRQRKEAELGYL